MATISEVYFSSQQAAEARDRARLKRIRLVALGLSCLLCFIFYFVFSTFYIESQKDLKTKNRLLAENAVRSQASNLTMEVFLGQVTAYRKRVERIYEDVSRFSDGACVQLLDSSGRTIFQRGSDHREQAELLLIYNLDDSGLDVGKLAVLWSQSGIAADLLVRYRTPIIFVLVIIIVAVITATVFAREARMIFGEKMEQGRDLAGRIELLKRRLALLEEFQEKAKDIGGVFVSYSSKDSVLIKRLIERFDEDGINYWLDNKELLVGDVIDAAVSKGIQDSWLFLVVLSPNSIKSAWVKREIDEAMHEEIAGNKIVLPVLANGLSARKMPARLRRKRFADLSEDFEGGYDDLRNSIVKHLHAFSRGRIPAQDWTTTPESSISVSEVGLESA